MVCSRALLMMNVGGGGTRELVWELVSALLVLVTVTGLPLPTTAVSDSSVYLRFFRGLLICSELTRELCEGCGCWM